MGYVFNQHQSIATNLNRILSEQVKTAIESLETPGEAKGETIHGVRKRIKKIRALYRLVRSELDQEVYQQANTHYRTLGHQLSSLRDATVMIKTLEKLQATYPDQLSPSLLAALRKGLTQKQDQANRDFFEDTNKIRQVADAFREAPLIVSGLAENDNAFSVLSPNMKKIYRRGRQALQVAISVPSMHHWHELRKEVKTIWYHTRLLEPIWPGLFAAYGQEFGRLGELLGDDHDYGVLADEIHSERLLLRSKPAREQVLQLLHQQRTRLQEQFLPLANRLFAEKAGEFVGRYRRHWKLWREEAKPKRSTNQNQEA